MGIGSPQRFHALSRDLILFREAPHASSVPISDRQLERELARQMLGYLTVP